jgi:hypothetical protein
VQGNSNFSSNLVRRKRKYMALDLGPRVSVLAMQREKKKNKERKKLITSI